jgi:threonyl-tRNA synthetase
MNDSVSIDDFLFLEQNMAAKIDEAIDFDREIKAYDDFENQQGQLENELSNVFYKFNNVSLRTKLNFLENSAQCSKNFKFLNVAQENYVLPNNMKTKVQKISVSAFFQKKSLDAYMMHLEELKKYDHRIIGQEMELFYMIPEAAGSVFWLPRGWKIFKALESYIRAKSYENYQEVKTPIVMSSQFWEKSGHMQAYGKNMMHVHMGLEECESAAIKPMNCPGHVEIFKHKIRSYRDLPLNIAEFGACHRYEPSGALHGLLRVRSFNMDDGHIFCTKEQIQNEVEKFMKQALSIYNHFGFDEVKIKIATRPKEFLGEIENWDYAESIMKEAIAKIGLEYEIALEEGAFYGPKIELHIKDSMSRLWQLGTIQLDFVLPERFDISYIDSSGQKVRPCMLHRAILGSMERFIGILLEHTRGNLPISIAPVQVVICSVTSDCNEYANTVYNNIRELGINVELDDRAETLSAKIRRHKILKVPILGIIGKKEISDESVTIEFSSKQHVFKLKDLSQLVKLIEK